MRTSQLIVAVVAVLLVAVMACQKAEVVPSPASFTVVNAMPDVNSIIPRLGKDTSGRYFNIMVQVGYGSSQLYSPVAGTNPLIVAPSTDTSSKVFNGTFSLVSGGIYSFFLSGDATHPDTLLVKDNIPNYTDSSAGIRFVNLTSGGKALSISFLNDLAHTEVPSLVYKQITDFKKYDASTNVGGSYTFEIRDQATGDSLTTYTWYYPVFKNNTIVIAGSTDPTSSTPLNVFSVNNY